MANDSTLMNKSKCAINFPDMFNGSKVKLAFKNDAIQQDLVALIASDRGALYGDPHFGTKIKTLLWDQAYDPIVRDLLKEDIFEAIYSYMPQVTVNRDSIQINVVDNVVVASINVSDDLTQNTNLYEIALLTEEESETKKERNT